MSKMSQLHAEFEESAAELGFRSFEEAEKAGYRPDYSNGTLYKHEPLDKLMDEAHEDWLKEKKKILDRLRKARIINDEKKIDTALIKAIKFIEGVKSE